MFYLFSAVQAEGVNFAVSQPRPALPYRCGGFILLHLFRMVVWLALRV